MKKKVDLIVLVIVLIEIFLFKGVHIIALVTFGGNLISKVLINAIMGN